jgi:hypothetical protein
MKSQKLKISHEFLKKLFMESERIYLYNIYEKDFQNYLRQLYNDASDILFEIRYQKIKSKWVPAGDEGEDFLYFKILDKWNLVSYPISWRSSGCRTLMYYLFYEGLIKEIPKNKLTTVLHDITNKRVFGYIKGFDPKKIKEIERKKLGGETPHYWNLYLGLKRDKS